MIEETGEVYVVSFMKKHTEDGDFNTRKRRVAADWGAAVQVADEHIDVDGATFGTVAGTSYLLNDGDKRVSIQPKAVHEAI